MRAKSAVIGMILASCGLLFAQQPPAPPAPQLAAPTTKPSTAPAAPAPLLKIADADPAAQQAVDLESLEISTTLNGPLAQTAVTFTFRNHLTRPLEGDLEFPLPENSAVVGYALDIPAGSANLVDGVAVEKERARQIFESEERRRVDPGLLEQTRGNNYRTRVHPIPAGGTRTVRITFVGDLAANGNLATYKLPLDFAGNIKTAKIHIEALGATNPSEIQVDGLKNIKFTAAQGRAVADQTFTNIALSGTLAISQSLPKDHVYSVVEQRPAGIYFVVSAIAPATPINAEFARPKHLTIIWDTSLSRADADRSPELETLRDILKNTAADFDIYSTAGNKIKTGKTAEIETTLSFLKDLPCDGALNLDAVNQTLNALSLAQPEPCLLFSDGLVTLGHREFHPQNLMIYTLCSDPHADHAFLKQLADATGGMYLNLQRLKPTEAAAVLTSPAMVMSFGTATVSQTKVILQQVQPAGPVRVTPGQCVIFTGELHANSVDAEITYGIAGGTMQTIPVKLSTDNAPSTGLVARYWAQQQVAKLERQGPQSQEALLAMAKSFNLVTSQTSLLVLETADQYVRYHVPCPKSRTDIYDDYLKKIDEQEKQQKNEDAEKIAHILALWDARVKWWDTRFTPPTKEQLAAAAEAAKAARPASGGTGGAILGGLSGTGTPSPMDTTVAPTTQASPTTSPGNAQLLNATLGESNQMRIRDQATPPNAQPITGTPAAPSSSAAFANPVGGATTRPPELASPLFAFRADETSASLAINFSRDRDWSGKDALTGPTNTINIKPWSPDTPYLRALDAAKPESALDTYFAQRKQYRTSPAFYLDCANWFLAHNQRETAIRLLTDIAQLRLENAPLLRVAAYRLLQIQEYGSAIDLFEQIKTLRPDEPQSWRDLALAISEEALAREWVQTKPNYGEYERQVDDLLTALQLYNHVIMNKWQRFDEIELVSLMEANALWERTRKINEVVADWHPISNPLDSRLAKNLDTDIRIVLTWDADNTDIDLHVIEPTGEEAFYQHNLTLSGGLVSRDFTQGYGPEEYLIHHAQPGAYKILANYFGSQQQSIQGPVTVQATLITNFGRPTEKHQSITLRLTEQKETIPIGTVDFAK